MTPEERATLIDLALAARDKAYAPYSRYRVGAALLDESGRTFTGCNVENAAYPVCCCAERTALFKAVSEGSTRFRAIAVVGGREGETAPLSGYAHPCGVCRQALEEFGQLQVIVARSTAEYKEYKLSELLPIGFNSGNL